MPDLYRYARPLLWSVKPETAHRLALSALRGGLGVLPSSRQARQADPPILAQTLWGLHFTNPIGVAAGFDKDGLAPDEILRLGFGCIEVGTVTPQPQKGNPQPRLFRLDADGAIINRMGFPSAGLDVVARRLARHRKRYGIVGVNLGKNRNSEDAAADYAEGIRRMSAIADYLVVNISSPNTPGLRRLRSLSTEPGSIRPRPLATPAPPVLRHGSPIRRQTGFPYRMVQAPCPYNSATSLQTHHWFLSV